MTFILLLCPSHADSGSLDSVGAFAGASHLGIKNLSFQSAGKNMNVYENCNISVNTTSADTEDNSRSHKGFSL